MSRKMKDSGVEWIGIIPESWSVGRTKNYYKNHKTIVKDKADEYERLALTLKGVIKRSKEDSNGLQPEKFEGYQILQKNELVFKLIDLENVSTSRVGLSPYEGIVSPAYIILHKKENISERYGEYYFLSMWQREIFNKMGDDGVRSSLNSSDLLNIPYLCPSLNEQEKIANYLDVKCKEIDNIISKTQASIEEYKKLKQSIITQTVTKGVRDNRDMKDSGIEWIGRIPNSWRISKIKYVSSISRGLFNHRPRNDARYYGGDYPFIQTGDVARSTKYIKTYTQTLNELGKNVSKFFPKGTLTMTIAANVGDVAIMDFDAYFPDSVIGFIPKEQYEPLYLFYIFSSMKDEFVRSAIVSTQLNLNIERVKELYIPIVDDVNEQMMIVNYLEKKCSSIDKLINKKTEILDELLKYKKSLIYEYVTGKKEVG